MRKIEELTDPMSCWSRADNQEPVFVLLGRDVVAPHVIRFWCQMRVDAGKNQLDDAQITSALQLAAVIEEEQRGKG